MDDDSVMRVICWAGPERAMKNKFYEMKADIVESRMHRIKSLFQNQEKAKEAASLLFSLELAAIYLVGRRRGIARALAALLMAIDSSACKRQANVMEVIGTVQGDATRPEVDATSVAKARKLYKHFIEDRKIPCDQSIEIADVLRRLSSVFLWCVLWHCAFDSKELFDMLTTQSSIPASKKPS